MDVASCSHQEEIITDESESTKLGVCEVCRIRDAKYTCPRCEVKTCSLSCNKFHKLELECNGERDRTKFLPINKFTNFDLSSDYRLLEEIQRVVDTSRKGRPNHKYRLDRNLIRLQKECYNRHIILKFLPTTFVKHKNNKTFCDSKKKAIDWHVDWIFVNSDNMKLVDKVPESIRISQALHKYLLKQDNPDLQEKLQYYQAADMSGIKVLLKAEQKAGKKFYELDPTATLYDCLKRKLIIEYPTIFVMLKDQANYYDIIDSDDEDGDEFKSKSGQEVINQIIKKAESNESIYESLKNLLFVDDYSDDELASD